MGGPLYPFSISHCIDLSPPSYFFSSPSMDGYAESGGVTGYCSAIAQHRDCLHNQSYLGTFRAIRIKLPDKYIPITCLRCAGYRSI